MNIKIGFVSLGCPKNLVDTEVMLGILGNNGYEIVSNPEDADVIVVNTCGFIDAAKTESIETILEMAQYKNNKCKLLIASGCLAERYHNDILEELPEVDAVVGTGDYTKIAEVIKSALNGEKPVLYGNMDMPEPEGQPRIVSTGNASAYLKIADGCDNRCTYCIIPKLRGKYRSRHIEDIVKEAES
ncbi:MAG: 30S ribosomal protein S12 methylthiotransferase RimO, partial [Clostridia bacterium]|nr:30S ribosomal protein S12 methylthiotransferase RimO [Clostridia bacterium]